MHDSYMMTALRWKQLRQYLQVAWPTISKLKSTTAYFRLSTCLFPSFAPTPHIYSRSTHLEARKPRMQNELQFLFLSPSDIRIKAPRGEKFLSENGWTWWPYVWKSNEKFGLERFPPSRSYTMATSQNLNLQACATNMRTSAAKGPTQNHPI